MKLFKGGINMGFGGCGRGNSWFVIIIILILLFAFAEDFSSSTC
jgi:hypothetical protein